MVEKNTQRCSCTAERPVHVRAYWRIRNSRLEYVANTAVADPSGG